MVVGMFRQLTIIDLNKIDFQTCLVEGNFEK